MNPNLFVKMTLSDNDRDITQVIDKINEKYFANLNKRRVEAPREKCNYCNIMIIKGNMRKHCLTKMHKQYELCKKI